MAEAMQKATELVLRAGAGVAGASLLPLQQFLHVAEEMLGVLVPFTTSACSALIAREAWVHTVAQRGLAGVAPSGTT